jgi:hypothetical protein
MAKFGLKRITCVKGRQKFYQLTINGFSDYQVPISKDQGDERQSGMLDLFESSLETRYRKDLVKIYAYMNMVAYNEAVPGTKYHELKREKKDLFPDFEFKSGDLRIYGAKLPGSKVIMLAGFKNRQKADIRKFRSLKTKFFGQLNQEKI